MGIKIFFGLALLVGAALLMSCSDSGNVPQEPGRSALIIVDMQYDFLPGGALPATGGDEIVEVINGLQGQFDLVVATQDWHPQDHGSFASNHPGRKPGEIIDLFGLKQELWPDHAVQESHGAKLAAELDQENIARVFRKGMDPKVDSYSGFFDNGKRGDTGLNDYLRSQGVTELFVVGLALDYCVKFTALDAAHLGFDTTLIVDASRAVNVQPNDGADAVQMMRDAGVRVIEAETLLGSG